MRETDQTALQNSPIESMKPSIIKYPTLVSRFEQLILLLFILAVPLLVLLLNAYMLIGAVLPVAPLLSFCLIIVGTALLLLIWVFIETLRKRGNGLDLIIKFLLLIFAAVFSGVLIFAFLYLLNSVPIISGFMASPLISFAFQFCVIYAPPLISLLVSGFLFRKWIYAARQPSADSLFWLREHTAGFGLLLIFYLVIFGPAMQINITIHDGLVANNHYYYLTEREGETNPSIVIFECNSLALACSPLVEGFMLDSVRGAALELKFDEAAGLFSVYRHGEELTLFWLPQ